jgi:hypothetical protein
VILEADDQTCSTFEAESATPPDEAQIQPICTYFSQTMFANMDKLPDFISSGDNKCDAPSPPSPPSLPARRPAAPPPRRPAAPPPRRPAAPPPRRPAALPRHPRSLAASFIFQPLGAMH